MQKKTEIREKSKNFSFERYLCIQGWSQLTVEICHFPLMHHEMELNTVDLLHWLYGGLGAWLGVDDSVPS